MVKFSDFTKEELLVSFAIAYRMCTECPDIYKDRLTAQMDISAVNAINPLRLDGLLTADELNFAHDIYGIYRHFDRQHGILKDCFVPRYSR